MPAARTERRLVSVLCGDGCVRNRHCARGQSFVRVDAPFPAGRTRASSAVLPSMEKVRFPGWGPDWGSALPAPLGPSGLGACAGGRAQSRRSLRWPHLVTQKPTSSAVLTSQNVGAPPARAWSAPRCSRAGPEPGLGSADEAWALRGGRGLCLRLGGTRVCVEPRGRGAAGHSWQHTAPQRSAGGGWPWAHGTPVSNVVGMRDPVCRRLRTVISTFRGGSRRFFSLLSELA